MARRNFEGPPCLNASHPRLSDGILTSTTCLQRPDALLDRERPATYPLAKAIRRRIADG